MHAILQKAEGNAMLRDRLFAVNSLTSTEAIIFKLRVDFNEINRANCIFKMHEMNDDLNNK